MKVLNSFFSGTTRPRAFVFSITHQLVNLCQVHLIVALGLSGFTFLKKRACCFTYIVFLMSCDWYCVLTFPHGVVGMSAMCDYGVSRSYSFTFYIRET